MKKTRLIIIIVAILVGGGAFYGGMKYEQSKSPISKFSSQFQKNAGGNSQRGAGMGNGANFLNGEVIAKDEQSLTLKMSDGGSKIIFFSDSTQISKTTDGSKDDIEIGKQIMVSGGQNSDGSYTAKTIQLSPRPVM